MMSVQMEDFKDQRIMHPNNSNCDILVTLTTFGFPFIQRPGANDSNPNLWAFTSL